MSLSLSMNCEWPGRVDKLSARMGCQHKQSAKATKPKSVTTILHNVFTHIFNLLMTTFFKGRYTPDSTLGVWNIRAWLHTAHAAKCSTQTGSVQPDPTLTNTHAYRHKWLICWTLLILLQCPRGARVEPGPHILTGLILLYALQPARPGTSRGRRRFMKPPWPGVNPRRSPPRGFLFKTITSSPRPPLGRRAAVMTRSVCLDDCRRLRKRQAHATVTSWEVSCVKTHATANYTMLPSNVFDFFLEMYIWENSQSGFHRTPLQFSSVGPFRLNVSQITFSLDHPTKVS